MEKTLILNLGNIKLEGNILDVGENSGIIYNISKEIMGEIAVDYIGDNNYSEIREEYDICTMFFSLSSIMSTYNKTRVIKEVSKYLKKGGEIYIWDINKEIKTIVKNKIMAIMPSGKTKEFEFRNLNPLCKSSIDNNEKLLEKYYKIEETKLWEDIHFIKGIKL